MQSSVLTLRSAHLCDDVNAAQTCTVGAVRVKRRAVTQLPLQSRLSAVTVFVRKVRHPWRGNCRQRRHALKTAHTVP
jgi:hypothetical protein